jgi:hypothetical protein
MRRPLITFTFTFMFMTLFVCAPAWVSAQRNSGAHFSGAHLSSVPGARTGVSAPHFGANFGGSRFSPPLALASGAYYDALLDAGYPVAAQPPVIIVQPGMVQSADTRRETFSSPTQPLMIELQGDRYVRVSGDDRAGVETIDRSSFRSTRAERPTAAALTPAVLVFRDGHREEISGYTIADGLIYASGDYSGDGSWNRRIQLSALNLPETIEANRARDVPFRLPGAPNEVIVRQ